MTAPSDLSVVIGLALLTTDRDPDEDAALARVIAVAGLGDLFPGTQGTPAVSSLTEGDDEVRCGQWEYARLIARIESRVMSLERRFADWASKSIRVYPDGGTTVPKTVRLYPDGDTVPPSPHDDTSHT